MSATLEKAKPARRSRLEIVDEALAKDEAALEAARAKFVELAAAEDAAVAEAKHADPAASPYTLRSPAQLIRDEREKLDRTIAGLERGIVALKSERVAASAEQAARELSERTKEARRLADRERELRREAGEVFAALVERWNLLADCLGERSALVSSVALEQLIERVGIFDREARERWQEAAAFVVEPVPTTLAALLDEAFTATMGADRDPDEGLDELNQHRARHGLPAEVRHVSPSTRELAAAYPDLRGEVRTAEVSGVAIRRSAGPGWPDQAA
jgi:hypothetical protein